ncbi:uncharacterized protein LOC130713282 [Lotus japonicus]|uniref:uncharacterized protein LOC130713282 n=1 Tax=Lotus japonicus TaxID=34305 RepID=UPI00258C31F5|nr:uncharacterized protein LOC130713282 [Lotus japonicus]
MSSLASSDNTPVPVTSPTTAPPVAPLTPLAKPDFHLALVVSNIKNHIPIMLDMETDRYGTWAELFCIHARSHRVLHHIVPAADKPTPQVTDPTYEPWVTLDATVLQWIYSTISIDLMSTIMEPDSTTFTAWTRLADLFQDNQNARVVTLEQEFSTVRMEAFPTVAT